MSVNNDQIRVKHIQDAIDEIIAFVDGETKDSFLKDRKLQLAIIRLIEIIGEAATRLSVPFKQKHETVPWQAIIGMRNRLIHAYFDVDLDRVWETVTHSIPELSDQIKAIIITFTIDSE